MEFVVEEFVDDEFVFGDAEVVIPLMLEYKLFILFNWSAMESLAARAVTG